MSMMTGKYSQHNLCQLFTMHFTPRKEIPISPLPPWLSRPLVNKIQKRRSLYHQALNSQNPHDWALYRS